MAIPAVPSIPCRKCGKKLKAGGTACNAFFPFCSERCRNADLSGWVNGEYAVEAPPTSQQDVDALIERLEQEQAGQ